MIRAAFWAGKRVLVTGNTGFKGAWLSLWLERLGAAVEGFALDPPTNPSLFESAAVGECVRTTRGDIGDFDAVLAQVDRQSPEIIFHLAAQSLVRRSYADPVGTYMTNVMGTVHVLEAARRTKSVRVLINVTSDKCYENRESGQMYRESDPMGGYDPYSSSKGCAELVSSAYRRSFFEAADVCHRLALATVRAGNVIGGGDWAEDRLIPDCVRALMSGKKISIRNPSAVRPWQYVLDPLAGYLRLAQLLSTTPSLAGSYNFGPCNEDIRSVSSVIQSFVELWGSGDWDVNSDARLHEASLLTLDSSLAREKLGWQPRFRLASALEQTVDWYRAYASGKPVDVLTRRHIDEYVASQPHATPGH